MKLLVSSVTRGDRVPKLSAKNKKISQCPIFVFKSLSRALSLASSTTGSRNSPLNWPVGQSTVELPELLVASGLAFWLQTQVTGKATGPLSLAGLSPQGSWPAHSAGMRIKAGMFISIHRRGLGVSRGLVLSCAISIRLSE